VPGGTTLNWSNAVWLEGVGAAEDVGDHRVVDDELRRRQRVHPLRVAAQLDDGLAHRGEVDDARYPGEVLHDHARGRELDLRVGLGLRVPAGERPDVGGRDVGAVLGAQEVLQEHLETERQRLRAVDRGQAEDLVTAAAHLERPPRPEAVLARAGALR
jgi:hypothetical protein